MTRWRRQILEPRVHGALALVATAVRVVTGVLFVLFGLGKFVDHASEVVDFEHYGIPAPDAAVYMVGALEVVGGALLAIGLMTRPAAALLALNMVGAIATAGRVDGGSFHLGVAPTLLLCMLFMVWAGSGRFAIDDRLAARP